MAEIRTVTCMEWQPIETAPKDGTVILAYLKVNGMVQAHYVSPAEMLASDDEEPRWFTTDGQELPLNYLTHWMPLPAAPSVPEPSP